VSVVAVILAADEGLEKAAKLIAAGNPVAAPTETVYGLAADATNGDAVARIYEVKGRPRFNPLIVHVDGMAMAEEIGAFDPLSRRLAEKFWPGPLTLVLPVREGAKIHPLVRAGLDTVALRMPGGFMSRLIGRVGSPLAAPSANSSGRISGTSAAVVNADLGARIALVIDGGPTPVGVESTIVKAEGERLRLLRPGGLAAEEIEEAVGMKLERGRRAGVEAPGMLSSHYAPAAKVRLNVTEVAASEALLAFGPKRAKGADRAQAVRNLSPKASLREAAANLFSMLQELDATGAQAIAVEPIPGEGLGEAINDRLRRAAAPRDIEGVSSPDSFGQLRR
jgi:L-threonylcarbamoyladenylate synthase